MTFHPQLHERITTISALFPGSKVELLVLDEGTAMVETIHGTYHCSALLDDTGRRALIVALGGLPRDNADTMVRELEDEAASTVETLEATVAELRAHMATTAHALFHRAAQLVDPLEPVATPARRDVLARALEDMAAQLEKASKAAP